MSREYYNIVQKDQTRRNSLIHHVCVKSCQDIHNMPQTSSPHTDQILKSWGHLWT